MLTRILTALLTASITLSITARAADEPAVKSGPEVGKDLPGTFHPYNVTGKRAGDFHDPLAPKGLEPVVLIFVRGTDAGDALKKLLTGLDEFVEKTPKARLGVAATFLGEELKDVVVNDDLRKKLADKLEPIKSGPPPLNHVILCLDNADGPKDYALNADAEVTVLVCDRLKVVANFAYRKNGFNAENAAAIVAAMKEKLSGAKK